MWKCQKCGEECGNDEFDTCWECGTKRDRTINLPGLSPSPRQQENEVSILKKILDRQDDQIYLMKEQVLLLKKTRWAIIGFAIWFIIQAWIISNVFASFR